MAKSKRGPSFRFNKNDSVGAAGAEEDEAFLRDCFVDTGDLGILKDLSDRRGLIIGRTGSGKTALIQRLLEACPGQAIVVNPEALALTYVANSTILRFFSELGVNLDPFFKLLWRHVLTVELLDKHFSIHSESDQKGLWERVKQFFSGDTRKEKEAQEALRYLETWGKSFWQETEFRVKEITSKLETELSAEVSAKFHGLGTSIGDAQRLGHEERSELQTRGQHIVSQAQVQDLAKVINLLDTILSNKQRGYYFIVDRLDEGWVEDKLRYRLIMALIFAARDFLKVHNAKIVIALRKDLIDRVFRLARESGFQQEKYEALYLRLYWSKDDILNILDRRIGKLVSQRYTQQSVTHRDLLPKTYRGAAIGDYIYELAQRPRDVIDLFNKCILAAADQRMLSSHDLKVAEGEYSKSRLKALGDEWSADYPELLDCTYILHGLPASAKVASLNEEKINELCLRMMVPDVPDGAIKADATVLLEGKLSWQGTRSRLVAVFYKVGLVGLKLAPHEAVSWDDERGRSVSAAEVDDNTSLVVHPMYHRALGIRL